MKSHFLLVSRYLANFLEVAFHSIIITSKPSEIPPYFIVDGKDIDKVMSYPSVQNVLTEVRRASKGRETTGQLNDPIFYHSYELLSGWVDNLVNTGLLTQDQRTRLMQFFGDAYFIADCQDHPWSVEFTDVCHQIAMDFVYDGELII